MALFQVYVYFPDIIFSNNYLVQILGLSVNEISYVVELTVPSEDGVDEASERKKTKYSELATEAAQNGWKTKIFPVEVGCRGFVNTSMTSLLKTKWGEGSLPPTTNQAIVKFSRKKQQLALD